MLERVNPVILITLTTLPLFIQHPLEVARVDTGNVSDVVPIILSEFEFGVQHWLGGEGYKLFD